MELCAVFLLNGNYNLNRQAEEPKCTRLPNYKNTDRSTGSVIAKQNVTQRIAHIDDDPDIRDTVRRILTANGYAVDSYQTMSDFMSILYRILQIFLIWRSLT